MSFIFDPDDNLNCFNETIMKPAVILLLFISVLIIPSCKKNRTDPGCFAEDKTIRQIENKQAVIKLTASADPVYIVEEGSVDTKLIPCNLPMEFYQNNLTVTISGNVKETRQGGPCCTYNFVIMKITR
jgi:hypothetical protein